MGEDKALLLYRGRPLIQHVLARLGRPALISARDDRLAAFGTVVLDHLPLACPLAGIHALVSESPTDRIFVCACDMPFVSLALAEELLGHEGDVVIPVTADGDQPLHAVYSKACREAIERCLSEGPRRATDFHDHVRTTRVRIDPDRWRVDGRSPFLNINSADDLGALG